MLVMVKETVVRIWIHLGLTFDFGFSDVHVVYLLSINLLFLI